MEEVNIRVTDNISVTISNEGWNIYVYEGTDDDPITLAIIRRVMEKYTCDVLTPSLILNIKDELTAEMHKQEEEVL